jgi:serine/threonine protein kinase
MSERQIQGEFQQFAHYRIGSVLGEGGFGRVHAAWDERLAREVAIKFASTDRRRQEALRCEAQRLASQRHRAFVDVFALEERPEQLALVMELVHGCTLAQKLKDEGVLPQEQVLHLAMEATAALADAHRSGWAHGDLKPSNLMLADDGALRILDFGAATPIDSLDTISCEPGQMLAGTLAYMAPERLLGVRASAQGDIYSLGLVLYEALNGRYGVSDENAWSALHRRLYGSNRGRVLPIRFDPGLRALIEHMTRRLTQARPASMAQVHRELVRLLAKQQQRRRAVPEQGERACAASTSENDAFSTAMHPPSETANAAVIRVSFDIEQRGVNLLWCEPDTRSDRDLYSATGRYAGVVHLRSSDLVLVEVTGYGTDDELVSTNLLDAMLTTVPYASSDDVPAPSPFSDVRATTVIEHWASAEIRHDRDKKLSTSVQRSVTPLEVVQRDGRWKLSLTLTVMIERRTAEGRLNEIRVFSFNPDIEVGPDTEPIEAFGEHRLRHSG